MANCKNCGQQLRDGAKFCENCGAKAEAAPVKQQPAPQAQAHQAQQQNPMQQQKQEHLLLMLMHRKEW